MTQRFSSKSRKTSKSFVIDDEILKIIDSEAAKEGISTNSKINTILGRWAFFYRLSEREHCATIASSTRAFIVREIDEQKWIEEYKSVLLHTIPAIMLEFGLRLDLVTVTKLIFEKALLYFGAYQGFNYYQDDNGYLNLVFRHQDGIKYSRIIGTAYSAFIGQVLKLPNTLEISERNAIIKLLVKNAKVIDDLLDSGPA